MRRVVGILIALIALSGCGTKGSLYLPPPEKDQQQDSKSTPRQ